MKCIKRLSPNIAFLYSVPKKDLLKKALDMCDINEESMFEPDYQEELEKEKVVVEKRVGRTQTEVVEKKGVYRQKLFGRKGRGRRSRIRRLGIILED